MNQLTGTKAISRRPLHLELAERIEALIVNGDLGPGTKVPEKDLCESFDVSRTPLREALKVLANEGLVTLEPNRGAWVTKLSLEDLENVFPVMGSLEALSGKLACEHITDRELAKIRLLHDNMIESYQQRNIKQYFQLNQSIHEAILLAARNDVLTTVYRSLANRVRRARYIANMSDERWHEAVEEHKIMLTLLENRDGDGLALLLGQHLQNKKQVVADWLRQSDGSAA